MTATLTVPIDAATPLTNSTIQAAVDRAAAAGGGTVRVPAGVYLMHDALHLRSGVHVVAEGKAVLRKVPSVQSPLLDYLGYGHYEFRVREPEKFRVGMGVHLLDKNAGGFYTTVATIIDRKGDRFFINRPLAHDYYCLEEGRAISLHSLIEGENVQNASAQGLVLDGNSAQEQHVLNGCRGGGVFLIMCRGISLRSIEVSNFRGDAISFQQCIDTLVDSCRVHHNTGSGLHPGSGSVRYVMRNNQSHDNGGCGLFYCLRTTHSICRGNTLRDNAWAGVSVGERDTDHLIEGNTITGNRHHGVEFRKPVYEGGNRVVLRGNAIGPNGKDPEDREVDIPAGLTDVHVLGNTITPRVSPAIRVGAGASRISVAGNSVGGRAQRAEDIEGDGAGAQAAVESQLPAVGPEALPLDGAAHLGVARLEKWVMPA